MTLDLAISGRYTLPNGITMRFKPGMHQITETEYEPSSPLPLLHDPVIVGNKPLDFRLIVKKIGEMEPSYSMPMRGWGKKCFIQVKANRMNDQVVIEFFSELVFSSEPSDPTLGFTEADTSNTRGVSIHHMDPATEDGAVPFAEGKVLPYEEFVYSYVTDAKTFGDLELIMNKLDYEVRLNDHMLEKVNSMWMSMEPGTKRLYNVRLQ